MHMRSCTPRQSIPILILLFAGSLWFLSSRLTSEIWPRSSHGQHIRGQPYLEAGASLYRQNLGSTRPIDTAHHSKTLGVASRLYVVSLPSRTDRRDAMLSLARAMDVEFTWHDATNMHSTEIQEILERIRWWRNSKRVNNTVPKADPSPFKFKWADDVLDGESNIGYSGADLWISSSSIKSSLKPLPFPPSPDTRPPLLDSYGENGDQFGTTPLRPAQIACWHSHYQVLRRIAEGDDEVAIIFEDDIDMEWDLEHRLRSMWEALPSDWEMVMLGHCHSEEWRNPPLKGAPNLHPAWHTLCTHAYAVNRRAAKRIVRRLRTEAFAYSRTVDHAFRHLSSKHTKVFSVYPPVVVQTYDMGSDIIPGRTNKDRVHWLEDSALERIELAKALDGKIVGNDGK